MNYDILLAGVGGQGVLSVAVVIASAAMADGLQVRQSEVHGMSQRGGGVQAHLRLSDKTIYSDLIPAGKAHMILSMEPMESLRYLSWLKPDGVVITAALPFVNIPGYPPVDTILSAIKKLPKSHIVNIAELAKEAGSPKTENMVLVGAALSYIPVSRTTIERSIEARFSSKDPALVIANITAIKLGEKAGMNHD